MSEVKKGRELFFRKTRKNKSRVEMLIIKVMAVLLKTEELLSKKGKFKRKSTVINNHQASSKPVVE